jgi:hypothetical protein
VLTIDFPAGTQAWLVLGKSEPTQIGGCGFVWAEGSDLVGLIRFGHLITDGDWDYISIGSMRTNVDEWSELTGTRYMIKPDVTDRLGVVWIKESDHEES